MLTTEELELMRTIIKAYNKNMYQQASLNGTDYETDNSHTSLLGKILTELEKSNEN